MRTKVELLAPAGDFISLRAAIKAGCDAVYFGIKGMNMRAGAKNFTLEDLPKIKKIVGDKKLYLTLNTIVFDKEIEKIENIIKQAKKYVDAIICWDMAIIELCQKYGVDFHISTQASVSNSASARFYKKLGAKRIVLARELCLEEIKKIIKEVDIEVEAFVHGAMCVAVSGRCFMSQFTFGRSANRGECLQNCRREYIIKEVDKEFELKLGNNFVMSAKDLCTIDFMDKLIDAGIKSFKIEGRNRSPEYVSTVVKAYKYAIENDPLKKEDKINLKEELEKVYNRGFSTGFYMNRPIEEFTDEYGSKATEKKEYVGKVVNYYNKNKVAEILVESNNFSKDDKIIILGETTGIIKEKIKEIRIDDKIVSKTKRTIVTIPIKDKVRKNDLVYVIVCR